MTSDSGTARDGSVKRYYSCVTRKTNHKCNKQSVRKEFIEELVVSAILETFGTPQLIGEICNRVLTVHEKRAEQNVVLNMLLKEAAKAQKAMDNILDAIENGVVQNAIQVRLQRLENRIEELNTQIEIERAKSKLLLTKSDITKYIKKAIAAEPFVLVKLLVRKVVLFNDSVEVYLNYTAPRNNVEHDAVTVHEDTTEYEVDRNLLHTKPRKAKLKVKIKI